MINGEKLGAEVGWDVGGSGCTPGINGDLLGELVGWVVGGSGCTGGSMGDVLGKAVCWVVAEASPILKCTSKTITPTANLQKLMTNCFMF